MGKYKGFSGSGMNQNKNVSGMLKRAQQMQEEMEKVQAELEEKTVEASAGGGAVNVVVSGKKELVSIEIKPEAVDPEDVEMLQDLVVSAINEAMNEVERVTEDEMNKITGGVALPGLF